jgi:hypothetical protein
MTNLTHKFTSAQGKAMTACIVMQGETYGLNNALTHDKEMPLIEFYFRGTQTDDTGAFISRYYLDTLMDTNGGEREGLCLDGRMREFDLSSEDMAGVATFVNGDVVNALIKDGNVSSRLILHIQVKSLSREQAEKIKAALKLHIASGEGGGEEALAPQAG